MNGRGGLAAGRPRKESIVGWRGRESVMEAKELLGAALSSQRLECFIRAGSALQRTFLCTVLILDTWACVSLHVCVCVRLLYVNMQT